MAIELTVMSLDFDSDEPPRKLNFSNGQVVFGRNEESDVVLQGEEVSGEHAKLFFKGDKLMISDLGSVNGTLVDNIPLEANKEVEVKENQRILISGYLIKPKIVEGQATEEEVVKTAEAKEEQVEAENPFEQEQEEDSGYEDVFAKSPIEEQEEVQAEESEIVQEISNEQEQVVIDPFSAPPAEAPPAEEVVNHASELVESANIQSESSEVEQEEVSTESQTSSTQEVVSQDLIEVNFEALKICKVSGKVLNKGLGLSGVQVTLNANSPIFTNEDGFFEIGNIEEDSRVRISFLKAGYLLEPREINLAVADDKLIEIEAKKLVTIKGKVANKGSPVADAIVTAKGIGETKTDADGVYEFKDVIEDTKLDISVSKSGFKFVSH